jgi:hypothetical protein
MGAPQVPHLPVAARESDLDSAFAAAAAPSTAGAGCVDAATWPVAAEAAWAEADW